MKLAIGADSVNEPLLHVVAKHLGSKGVEFTDMPAEAGGTSELYAETAERVRLAIARHDFELGILFCGTGVRVYISANKVPGIRAALTHDTYQAERASKSNNAQTITVGARVIGPELAKAVVDIWLALISTPGADPPATSGAIDALDDKYFAKN